MFCKTLDECVNQFSFELKNKLYTTLRLLTEY